MICKCQLQISFLRVLEVPFLAGDRCKLFSLVLLACFMHLDAHRESPKVLISIVIQPGRLIP